VRHESFRDSEFFDPEDVVQVKYEMLRQVDIDKQPVSQAAKMFGFSRPSNRHLNPLFTSDRRSS